MLTVFFGKCKYLQSIYIFFVLFISKRVMVHYGELISIKFNKFRTNQNISILFEDSTSVDTPPPMGGCMSGWMDGWVNG